MVPVIVCDSLDPTVDSSITNAHVIIRLRHQWRIIFLPAQADWQAVSRAYYENNDLGG
jgi:hypothetical protein